jgi:uncharacterized protein YaiI (UPF0178 family)
LIQRISQFKRTQQFVSEDYNTLIEIINYFRNKIITTPNILTEVNSLANQLGEPERSQCFTICGQDISGLEECYTESRTIAQNDKFTKFGLTDCSIINLVKNKYLVLTDDLRLASYLQKQEIDTVNFNNIRIYRWQ